MKGFFIKLIIFLLVAVAIIGLLNRNYYPAQAPDNDNFMAAMIDKHVHANRTPSPRIVFCGGSNLAFGINSQQIEKQTGMPVVNLGLYAGFGLDFMLNEVKAVARPGDIVVVSPEYFLSVDGNYKMKKLVERIYPTAGAYFKPTVRQLLNDYFIEDLQSNLPNTINGLRGKAREVQQQTVYARSSYNKYGDVVRNFEANPPKDFFRNYKMDYAYYDGIPVLNDFTAYAVEHKLRVYLIYPNFPQSLYRQKSNVIEKLAQDLSADLHMPILGTSQDAVFADSLFYNTEYHLTPQGRQLRTKKVIDFLRPLVK